MWPPPHELRALRPGQLVKTLISAGVADYLDFKVVDGCFVYKKGKGVYKMPATATEAATTSLMGFFQKRHFKSFLNWVFAYEQVRRRRGCAAGHSSLRGALMPCLCDQTKCGDFDATKKTMAQLYSKFSLDKNTQDFVGHAMALYTDDSYIDQPAAATVERIKLYGYSMQRYGKSPFIYPVWGIGGMPEGFSRCVMTILSPLPPRSHPRSRDLLLVPVSQQVRHQRRYLHLEAKHRRDPVRQLRACCWRALWLEGALLVCLPWLFDAWG